MQRQKQHSSQNDGVTIRHDSNQEVWQETETGNSKSKNSDCANSIADLTLRIQQRLTTTTTTSPSQSSLIVSPTLLSCSDTILDCVTGSSNPPLNLINSSTISSTAAKCCKRLLLICDAWYGFPSEKRPKKERILGVCRQLCNFLEWQQRYIHRTYSRSNDFCDLEVCCCCHVQVVGKAQDVSAIRDRMHLIWKKEQQPPLPSQKENYYERRITFSPGMTIETLCQSFHKNQVIYLSPDANNNNNNKNGDNNNTLSPHDPPPTHVIVGMLVDRRLQPFRSKTRAESLSNHCTIANLSLERAFRRPCSTTVVTGSGKKDDGEKPLLLIQDEEALNIDTVLELMQRWHFNYHDKKDGTMNNMDCFVDAARMAWNTHEKRHPNRTLHGGVRTTASYTGT